jgi:hypothetical protein
MGRSVGRIGDKRTEAQIRRDLQRVRNVRMENANLLAFDLLDHGYNVWIDMAQINSHGDFYCYIVINEVEMGSDRFDDLVKIAEAHDANVTIKEVRMNQQNFSRIVVWPAKSED